MSPAVVPVMSEVLMELLLSDKCEPFTARGRSVWFRTLSCSDQVEIGIVFHDLTENDMLRLSGYIETLSQKITTEHSEIF